MADYLNSKLNSPYLPDLQPLPNFALQDLQNPNPPMALSSTAPTQNQAGTAGTLALLAQMGALGSKSQGGSSSQKKDKNRSKDRTSHGGGTGAKGLPNKIGNSVNQNRKLAKSVINKRYENWNQKDYRDLVKLWNNESGWQAGPSSDNPTSSAYGIPQALTSLHKLPKDYMHSPLAQIIWGLHYIQGRYGSPTKAWHEWQSRSPHWY